MSKRMTVIFEDEALYTALKIEAVRRGMPAKDIVSEAVREWLEAREDEELGPEIEAALREYEHEEESTLRSSFASGIPTAAASRWRARSGSPQARNGD